MLNSSSRMIAELFQGAAGCRQVEAFDRVLLQCDLLRVSVAAWRSRAPPRLKL
jgi:hypothetical protein